MKKQITRGQFIKTMASAGLGAKLMGKPLPTEAYRNNDVSDKMKKNGFPVRGFDVDMRSEVMTIDALKKLADELAPMGVNALVMEYEATFPYKNNLTIRNKNAYSREEIKDFVSHCASLNIEVIPLQESLGHVQYILRHDRYADLRIERDILSQVDPLNDKAISLFKDLIDDISSLHPSRYVHVGGDEVRHLTNKKFSSYVKKYGVSKLYTQYMKQICQIVIDLGKTPLIWADMILKHPKAINDLPIDKVIFVDWNYGWPINMFGNIAALQKKGCTFWGAPALRSSPDNYFITRWKKHFDNLKDYIPYTRKANYQGIMMTSWSTSGVYGYKWEDGDGQLLEMFPIRNVYPLSGFRILMEAYSRSLQDRKALNPHDFVLDYTKKRFGLSNQDAEKLWNYLSYEQVLLKYGKPENKKTLDQVIQDFRDVKKGIYPLKPSHNKEEFEHYRLMADIREFYLKGMQLQNMFAGYDGTPESQEKIYEQINGLTNESVILDKRFNALNKNFLKEDELKRLNGLRNERLHDLKEKYNNFIYTTKFGEKV